MQSQSVNQQSLGSEGGSPPTKKARFNSPTSETSVPQPASIATAQLTPSYPVPIPAIANQPTQQWHHYVNPDLRQHLVRKIVEAIYPVYDPAMLRDPRVARLVQYAMKVEKATFEAATSREEYYQLLTEKIYRICRELEERRKVKEEMEKRMRMGVSAGIPAALAGKIHWIYKALEERGKVMNGDVTRRFLEGSQVKEEVEKRMRTGDW